MKKKIYTFIALSLIFLAIAPAINLKRLVSQDTTIPSDPAALKKEMYNMDFSLQFLGRIYYSLGISISPNQAIIGKSGWLFLGDESAKTITVRRNGVTDGDLKAIRAVDSSATAWNEWLKGKGVNSYKILIGPDKASVYSEHLPKWAYPSSQSIADAIVRGGDESIFVYPKQDLIESKSKYSFPLYYKTDTHWNTLGAWIAFRRLAESLAESNAGLSFPENIGNNDFSGRTRTGGDLAKFLRIPASLVDTEISIKDNHIRSFVIEQRDYSSMELTSSGGNKPVGAPTSPLLVTSASAMNKKKVLWLRDSFGSSLSPFMSATFSEILHIHVGKSNPKIIADLIHKFKPDYVIVTCVERNAHSGFMTSLPPGK